MDSWTDDMQLECAASFQKEKVVRLMSSQNQQKLMEETVNIILDSDIAKEDVSH